MYLLLPYLTTVIAQATAFPSDFTVIIVVPAFSAVTSPSGDTEAIDADFDVYVIAVPDAFCGFRIGFS